MNKKGQALVEFILILPIFIMILLASFDWVRIIQTKIELQNDIEDYISLNVEKSNITSLKKDDYIVYKASKDLDIYSPILTVIISDKYKVEVERSVYDK